ncbi:unnamed protein product [Rangifer tarandus platyrhynchus]|uniref:Uncharacterized protein n=2 Tax=Rangifer tarandus platyrhynchus TaxID=3082113 RepID=A0ACB0FI91_RANTA|nr:unnamed protein product [Rangifer tarandus platyrhynchus]CAI9712203.1 unnamed protein product [Rangifer tarandus platyrhynchus]
MRRALRRRPGSPRGRTPGPRRKRRTLYEGREGREERRMKMEAETEMLQPQDKVYAKEKKDVITFICRLSHEYSKHGLPDYATHGKNQQEAMYMVERNGRQQLLQIERAPVTPAGGLWRCQPVCASVSACPRLGGPTRSSSAPRPGEAAPHRRLARSRCGGLLRKLAAGAVRPRGSSTWRSEGKGAWSACGSRGPRVAGAAGPRRAFALGRRPREPHAAPALAAAAARLPGAGPGPEPRSPAPERRRRDAPRRLRARAAPGAGSREPGAPGSAGRPTPPPPPPRAGAGLPARSAGPALPAPERRSAAGLPASSSPRRQGHGGAAGSEPRPGVPETSELPRVRVSAAVAV